MKGTALSGRIAEVSRLVEMNRALDRKIGGYSKGMKQRMKIAGALLHDPDMLILDEPLSGTDPLVRKEIIDLIKRLNKENGHDVIVSSHVLFEIERMTHGVVLIYKGRAVATGDISEIRDLIDKHPHNIVIEERTSARSPRRSWTNSPPYRSPTTMAGRASLSRSPGRTTSSTGSLRS